MVGIAQPVYCELFSISVGSVLGGARSQQDDARDPMCVASGQVGEENPRCTAAPAFRTKTSRRDGDCRYNGG